MKQKNPSLRIGSGLMTGAAVIGVLLEREVLLSKVSHHWTRTALNDPFETVTLSFLHPNGKRTRRIQTSTYDAMFFMCFTLLMV